MGDIPTTHTAFPGAYWELFLCWNTKAFRERHPEFRPNHEFKVGLARQLRYEICNDVGEHHFGVLEEGDVVGSREDDGCLELDFEILRECSPWRVKRQGWLITLKLAAILKARDAAEGLRSTLGKPRPLVTVSVFVWKVCWIGSGSHSSEGEGGKNGDHDEPDPTGQGPWGTMSRRPILIGDRVMVNGTDHGLLLSGPHHRSPDARTEDNDSTDCGAAFYNVVTPSGAVRSTVYGSLSRALGANATFVLPRLVDWSFDGDTIQWAMLDVLEHLRDERCALPQCPQGRGCNALSSEFDERSWADHALVRTFSRGRVRESRGSGRNDDVGHGDARDRERTPRGQRNRSLQGNPTGR